MVEREEVKSKAKEIKSVEGGEKKHKTKKIIKVEKKVIEKSVS